MTAHGVAASVRARLLNRARAEGRSLQELLEYFAMERFLYRLSRSPHAERFVLKGALMLQLWCSERARATRDIDLLGFVPPGVDDVAAMIRDVLEEEVEDDGVLFQPESLSADEIRARARYRGVRARFVARVGAARIPMQIDVGFGDVVTPGPVRIEYPGLLSFDPPKLRGYTPETTIAEKLEAIVILGLTNTRMKDYYDLWHLARTHALDADVMGRAVRATFERRETPLPSTLPVGLQAEFFDRDDKQRQRSAWLRRLRLHEGAPSLAEACALVASLAEPVFGLASSGGGVVTRWPAGGPWEMSDEPEKD